MPASSALARLQQSICCVLALAAAAWFGWRVSHSAWQALAGSAAIVFGYAFFLALEFLILARVVRADDVPQPGARALLKAWWNEALQVPRVFYWRQPWRWRAEPDHIPATAHGRRGVVFVHGFVCNRGFWSPWLRQMRERGHPFAAVNLEPVFGSIDEYATIIEAAVGRMQLATGRPPLLVCHSMGGLAARAWLRQAGDPARVHGVVTIGSPHHGTWLARFSHLANGRQMRTTGAWLQTLEASEATRRMPAFTCWYSNCDNIVFPPSTARMPGADNRLVAGAAHVDLAFRPEVMAATLAMLDSL